MYTFVSSFFSFFIYLLSLKTDGRFVIRAHENTIVAHKRKKLKFKDKDIIRSERLRVHFEKMTVLFQLTCYFPAKLYDQVSHLKAWTLDSPRHWNLLVYQSARLNYSEKQRHRLVSSVSTTYWKHQLLEFNACESKMAVKWILLFTSIF